MGIFDGCLLASDLDETLISNSVIPERNKEKIKFFEENGGMFLLNTGRLPCGMERIETQLELGLTLGCNGGLAYNYRTGETVFADYLSKNDYKALIKSKEIFPNTPILCEDKDFAYIPNINDYALEHIDYEGLKWTPLDMDKIYEHKFNKAVCLCQSLELCNKIAETIKPLAPNSEFTISSLTRGTEERYVLEQMPKGVSKATGLLKLADILGVKKGNIFAIGDYFNDLEMLKVADISAATFGAPDEIKSVCTVTVGSASNGAVADFIDYLYEKRR